MRFLYRASVTVRGNLFEVIPVAINTASGFIANALCDLNIGCYVSWWLKLGQRLYSW
jgi:hypothetical protein